MKRFICFLLCLLFFLTFTSIIFATEWDNYYEYEELSLPINEKFQELVNRVFVEKLYISNNISDGRKPMVLFGDNMKLEKEALTNVERTNNFIRSFIPYIYKVVKSHDRYAIYVKSIGFSWFPKVLRESWENGSFFDLKAFSKLREQGNQNSTNSDLSLTELEAVKLEFGMLSEDVFLIIAEAEQGDIDKLKFESGIYYRSADLGFDDFVMFGKVPILEIEKQDLFLYFRQVMIDAIEGRTPSKNLIIKEYDFE